MSGSPGQSSVLGRTLKVYWETSAGDYDAAKLRGIFESFGIVEDVVIRSKKKATVVMTSREAAVRAVLNLSKEIRNPLFVVPLEDIVINKVWGIDFQNYKAFGMELQKANEQKWQI